MEGEVSLAPYSKEQITKGEKLPEKISSIRHDVETGEKLKLDFVVEQVANVSKLIKTKSENKFVILGSMGMYITLNELRENGEQLMLLEQRIAGGKNDYDVGVHPEKLGETMVSFGWNEETRKLQRGRVGEGSQMVDMMGRRELAHFPWRQTEVGGQSCFVQQPEEMVFEKISALVNPGSEDNGEAQMREVKWGVDIKLLKTYLMVKNDWTEVEVENNLARKWEDYVEDTRYLGVAELADRVGKGESAEAVIKDELQKRLGKQVENPRAELLTLFRQEAEPAIQKLMASTSAPEFSDTLRGLVDLRAMPRFTYAEASQKATEAYTRLLEGLP